MKSLYGRMNLQPITFQMYRFSENISVPQLPPSYFYRTTSLAEDVSTRIRNAFPNALKNLIMTDEEIFAFICLVRQIQSDIQMDHFNNAQFKMHLASFTAFGINPDFCSTLVRSLAIGFQIEIQHQKSQTYFPSTVHIPFSDFVRDILKTNQTKLNSPEIGKTSIFMECINSRDELDNAIALYSDLKITIPHSKQHHSQSLLRFLIPLLQQRIPFTEPQHILENFIRFIESRTWIDSISFIHEISNVLIGLVEQNPFGKNQEHLIRIIRVIGKIDLSEQPLFYLAQMIHSGRFINENDIIKSELVHVIEKMEWKRNIIAQAMLTEAISYGALGNQEKDLEVFVQIISKFELDHKLIQSRLFDTIANPFFLIAGSPNCSSDTKSILFNQIFKILNDRNIQIDLVFSVFLIYFILHIDMLPFLILQQDEVFKDGSHFINRFIAQKPLVFMMAQYIKKANPSLSGFAYDFCKKRFDEVILTKLSQENIEQLCTAFTLDNPSNLFSSLYPVLSADENSMIFFDSEYIDNLIQNKVADLNRFALLTKTKDDLFQLNLEGNRPGIQDIFKSFPELNAFYKNHENSSSISHFFGKLGLNDFLTAFEEALRSDKSSVKFVPIDESEDDAAQQEKIADIFAHFLVNPDTIMASGGTSLADDAQLGKEILVTDKFLDLIYSSFENSDKLDLKERSNLLFSMSSIFYRLSSSYFFGTSKNSPTALRNIALGLLNKSVQINPSLLSEEELQDYTDRSLEAIVSADGKKAFGCTEVLSGIMLEKIRKIEKENPTSIVAGLIPIAWKSV